MKLTSRSTGSLGNMGLSTLMGLLLVACGGGASTGTTGTSGTTGTTGSSTSDPSVSSFSPSTAVVGKSTTYLIKGANLPSNVVVTLTDGTCLAATEKTASSFSVVCTAGNNGVTIPTSITKVMTVTGSWWLGKQDLVVTPQPALTFSPNTAAPGVATTYQIGNGTDLTDTVNVTLAEGSCAAPTAITSTSFTVVCTPGLTEGNKSMIVYNKPKVDGGWWLGQQELVVGSSPSSGPPSISSFSPKTAVVGVATTYLIKGLNLPSTVNVTLAEGSCLAATDKTSTGFSVVCTAGLTVGNKQMVVNTKPVADGGYWVGAQDVAVTLAPGSTVTLLNDTGITANQCYAANSNALFSCTSVDAIALNDKQDGMVGRDVTSSDSSDGLLGSSYRLVGAAGATECVKDEVTGKTWQRASSTLPAYPADPSKTSNAASGDMILKAEAARDAANAAALCGYTDWTIPSPFDLQGLVNYSASSGVVAIDSNWFTAKSAGYFTSAQYLNGGGNYRWRVDFGRGIVTGVVDQWASAELRLMRATTTVANRFSYSSDGSEVTDAQTGLVWQRCSVGQTWSSTTSACTGGVSVYAHADALAYAKTQTGWRLPNVKELLSVVKTTTAAPATDVTAFPSMPNTTGVAYWTSTPDVQSPASAWCVEFSLGEVASYTRSSSNFVRLVR